MMIKTMILGVVLCIGLTATTAHARCTKRVADALIIQRYQECSPKKLISFLYNDLVTSFSFRCVKKVVKTCEETNCEDPTTPEDKHRCQVNYVNVLNDCIHEVDGAAKMARCKDTGAWAVEPDFKSPEPAAGSAPETPPSSAQANSLRSTQSKALRR